MKLTGAALTECIRAHAQERVRRVLVDHGWSSERIAGALGLSKSRVEAWWSQANPPLYLLCHAAIPHSLVLAIVATLIDSRGEDAPTVSPEVATALVARFAGQAIEKIGSSMIHKNYDDLRRAVSALHDVCGKWLRQHHSVGVS